jgi:arginine repressor
MSRILLFLLLGLTVSGSALAGQETFSQYRAGLKKALPSTQRRLQQRIQEHGEHSLQASVARTTLRLIEAGLKTTEPEFLAKQAEDREFNEFMNRFSLNAGQVRSRPPRLSGGKFVSSAPVEFEGYRAHLQGMLPLAQEELQNVLRNHGENSSQASVSRGTLHVIEAQLKMSKEEFLAKQAEERELNEFLSRFKH